MTLVDLKKIAPEFYLSPTSDGDGVPLTAVRTGKKTLAFVFAGENRRGKIEQIEVIDPSYETAQGVHPQMPVEEAEKKIGKLVSIHLSEIEAREFAEFDNCPGWLGIRLLNSGGPAGLYPVGARTTRQCRPGARVYSLLISGK